MLDVNDFIAERGGDPEKIRESQRRRFSSVEVVDEIIALFEDHRKSPLFSPCYNPCLLGLTICEAQYSATQINSKINDVQKQIGMKKKVLLPIPQGIGFAC